MPKKKKIQLTIIIDQEKKVISVQSPAGIEMRNFGSMPWGVKVEIGGVTLVKKRLFDIGPVLEFHKKSYAIEVNGRGFEGYQVPIAV